jgi:hypothetical protein
MNKKEWKAHLGESIHCAFRKAADSEESHKIHGLIRELPEDEWDAILGFVYDCINRELKTVRCKTP